MVAAVTHLAHDLGKLVTAEGVETAAQRDEVVSSGCKLAQGFFFARPTNVRDLAAQLAEPRVGRCHGSARRSAVSGTWWEGGVVGAR